MTASLDWMPIVDDKPPNNKDLSPLTVAFIAPVVTGIVLAACLGIGVAALGVWRSEPVTTAEISAVKSEVAALKLEQSALIAKIGALETTDRQRSLEIHQLSKTLDKIEAYQGTTMKHVQEINIQLAEMRGGQRKPK
jgi:TolA-binding protein